MKLLRMPLVLLLVMLLRLLRGRVKIGILLADRLGHLAGNTEVYLCERDAGLRKGIDIWTHGDNVANQPLLEMIKRAMPFDRTGLALKVATVNRTFPGWERYEVEQTSMDRDIHCLFDQYKPHLAMRPENEQQCAELLAKYGIKAPWVCLIVRDSAYLPELNYHSYRDSDIDTYMLAAEELAQRGYTVIRMGAKVAKPFVSTNPRIIDFPFHIIRSDLMSIYLGSRCAFCVSSGTGFDAIPYIFRRPICYVNYVPLEYLFTFARDSLAIWKHHEKDGKRMTPAEIYASGAGQFMSAAQFEQAGITLVDNTPEEIADVVREMAMNMTLGCTSPEAEARQSRFWQSYPRAISPYTKKPLHGAIQMRIGSRFLSQYEQSL